MNKEYLDCRKEFINCICMSPITLFISLYIGLTYWLPKMRAAKKAA